MSETEEISLICRECEHENTVKLSTKINCKNCEEPLTGKKYKGFLIPAIAVIALSGIGGAMIDDTLNVNRASVKVEYKMMKTCIDKHWNRYRKNEYVEVRNNCVCVVESMSGLVDAEKARFGNDKSGLKLSLRKDLNNRYKECSD